MHLIVSLRIISLVEGYILAMLKPILSLGRFPPLLACSYFGFDFIFFINYSTIYLDINLMNH